MTTRYLILQGRLISRFKYGKEKQERLFYHFFFSNEAAQRYEQCSADWGIKVWTLNEQTEERGVLFLFQGGNMIYVPLTIKSISIIGTSVRHQLATLSARPLSLFFFIAMHCISIGIYIPLLHIADMDGLTHFLCLDNWAHFVCVLFYFRISFILCDFLSA